MTGLGCDRTRSLPARADNLCVASSAQKQASTARRAKNRARGKERPYARVRARPIRPGGSYKVTRRRLDRRMFLTPGDQPEEMRNFLGYCLAYTANKYGIQVHAAVMMPNHYHIDLTDPHGELVAFKQLFNSLVARGLNAERARFETFWSGDGPCDTQRPSDDETFMDLVYTISNPVKSALVKWSRDWPSFTTADWRFGETRTFKRPGGLFGERSELPDEVSLTLVRPPIFRELDDDALYDKLALAVREKERELQAEHRAKGRRFMGGRSFSSKAGTGPR